jgi:hypothetical protein
MASAIPFEFIIFEISMGSIPFSKIAVAVVLPMLTILSF